MVCCPMAREKSTPQHIYLADLCACPSTPSVDRAPLRRSQFPAALPLVSCPFQFTATGVLLSPIQGAGGEGGPPSSLVPPQLPVYPPSALTLAANAAYSPKLAALRTAGPSTLPVVLAAGRLCSLRYFV